VLSLTPRTLCPTKPENKLRESWSRLALHNTSGHQKEISMPLVNVKIMEGVFTPKQKQDIIHNVTDAMVRVEGENMRPYTLVVLEELKSGD
jgi:4-oxalocrotonate tautomerase